MDIIHICSKMVLLILELSARNKDGQIRYNTKIIRRKGNITVSKINVIWLHLQHNVIYLEEWFKKSCVQKGIGAWLFPKGKFRYTPLWNVRFPTMIIVSLRADGLEKCHRKLNSFWTTSVTVSVGPGILLKETTPSVFAPSLTMRHH